MTSTSPWLTVVVEGVETQEQAEALGRQSCHEIHGFWFSGPSPAADVTELLRS